MLTTLMLLKPPTPHVPPPQMSEGAGAGAAIAGLFVGIIYLAIIVLLIAGFWKIFTKAGQPGWMAIIPILNLFVLLKIVGKPGWWIVLYCIPFLNAIAHILVALELAKVFGKGTGFAVGLIVLPFIFYPMLGFGSATYLGAAGQASPMARAN
jgi:hypothetical protein